MTTDVAPKPHETMIDEGGATISWLAEAWSPADIEDEYEVRRESLTEVWMGCRWTTDAEKANEDVMYDLFGDYEMNGIDTSVVYWFTKPKTPGAHRYWTTEPPHRDHGEASR